jgi:hypothetical protein
MNLIQSLDRKSDSLLLQKGEMDFLGRYGIWQQQFFFSIFLQITKSLTNALIFASWQT